MKNYFFKYSLFSLLISISTLSYTQQIYNNDNKTDSIKISLTEYESLKLKKEGVKSLPNVLINCKLKNEELENNVATNANKINQKKAQRDKKVIQDSLYNLYRILKKEIKKREQRRVRLSKYEVYKNKYLSKQNELFTLSEENTKLHRYFKHLQYKIDMLQTKNSDLYETIKKEQYQIAEKTKEQQTALKILCTNLQKNEELFKNNSFYLNKCKTLIY